MAEYSEPDVYFSKHLFRTGLECPTRLYYRSKDYPENRESLPFIAHYRYNKRQLKSLARCSYPEGIQIDTSSVKQAFEETKRFLKKEEIVLFDPVFLHNRFKAKIPILVKKGTELHVYHIQIKAFQSGKHRISSREGRVYSKWLDYITDFAFQVHILGKCYPAWKVNPYLVLPAKYSEAMTDRLHDTLRRIKKGEISPEDTEIADEKLLVYIDVAEEINRVFSGKSFDEDGPFTGKSFNSVLEVLADQFYSDEKYPVTIGSKCKSCEFRIEQERVKKGTRSGFIECWNTALDECLDKNFKPLVFNLIGPGTNHWIEREVYFQENVPDGEFYDMDAIMRTTGKINEKQRQSLQIMQAKGRSVPKEIVRPKLFEELERWTFPIHFLDFEAGNYAVPTRKNRRPYHLIVFQYSCHTLFQDGTWDHHEWIDELDRTYPNYEMVRYLKNVPHIDQGTIVQYSNFERNTLKVIRKELLNEADYVDDAMELSEWINQIIRRHDSSHNSAPFLADLSRLVKNYYYNHKMEDSLSIKDVLQSVLTVSPRLKDIYSRPYKSSNFDSTIWWQQDSSGEALSPYRLMPKEQKQGVRRGTEAMVVYAKLLSEDLSQPERAACKKSLLRYCEVDTLAMFMIYQHWMYLMEQNWN